MKKKNGFTLVELSIVLVVIGLLIGGILAGQSMISTSKVNAEAMQIGQFDAGVENFKTKYNYLPGDAPAFGGDGDGLIDDTAVEGCNGNGCANNSFECEVANFWNNLDPQDYANVGCVRGNNPAVTNGINKNVPLSKLGSSGAFFIASAIGDGADFNFPSATPQNFYAILAASNAQSVMGGTIRFNTSTITNSAVKPVDLLALDKKIDDGLANSGNVISGETGSVTYNIVAGNINPYPSAGICSNATTYYINNPGYECTPLIRIGASVNDPQ